MGAKPEMGGWSVGRRSPGPGWGAGGRGECRLRNSLLGDTGEVEGDPGSYAPGDDPAKKLPSPNPSICPFSFPFVPDF